MSAVFKILLCIGLVLGVIAALLIWRARNAPRSAAAASSADADDSAAPGWISTALAALDYARTRREWRYRMPWILMLGERDAGKTSFALSAAVRLAQSNPDRRYASLRIPGSAVSVMNRGVLIDIDGSVSSEGAHAAVATSVVAAGQASAGAAPSTASSATSTTSAANVAATASTGTPASTTASTSPMPAVTSRNAKKARSRWETLLRTLVDLRPERPADGIVLTVSARSLLSATPDQLERLGADAYRQLCDVQDAFRFVQPVSVVVTQCDRIDGFAPFWRAQPDALRQQMFGWSAPVLASNDTPQDWCHEAFRVVIEQLRALQIATAASAQAVANDLDRDGMLLFPARLDQLRAPLAQWLAGAFRATLDRPGHLCRGVYFTGDLDGAGVGASANVSFVAGLLDDKVFAERGNARVVRASAWSRNRYLRGFQVAALGVAAALTIALGFAGARLYTTVGQLDRALVQLQTIRPYSGGVCPSASEISTVLMSVHELDTRSFDLANPWSWPWFWHPLRDGAAQVVAGRVFAGLVLPGLGCQLAVRAKALSARGTEAPRITGDPGEDARNARSRLNRQLREVTDLEAGLGTFYKIAEPFSGAATEQDVMRFARLVNFAYGLPVSLVMRDGDSGLLAASLSSASTDYRPDLPENLAASYRNQLAQMETDLRDALVTQAGSGQQLLVDLQTGHGDPAAQTRQLVAWLAWTRDNWLGAVEQEAQRNLCGQIRTDLRQQIRQLVLVDASSGRSVPGATATQAARASPYAALLETTASTFSAAECDDEVYRKLDALSVPPYNPLIVREQGRRAFNASFTQEFAGLAALSQLHFMQVTKRRTAFACSINGAGANGARSWNAGPLGDAAAYIDEYRRFAQRFAFLPARVPASSGLPAAGPRPLYAQIAATQLENSLNDALLEAQSPPPPGPDVWPAATTSNALSAVPFDEQALAQASRDLSRTLGPLIQVERAYSEFDFSKGFSALSGCLQQYAADRLSTVGSLAVQSQLYQPQSDTTGGEFFELGTVPVTRDYLARQVARSQVLAAYAAPFATLAQNSGNAPANSPNVQTAAYWGNSIAEVNRYVPSNDPASQMGQLASLFVDRLNGMTTQNCNARLQDPASSTDDGANDLFAARRRDLVKVAQSLCQGSDAVAFQNLFSLFDATLGGRYPFGLAGAPEASPLAVRDFFAVYAQQSAALRAQLTRLPKTQRTAASAFLDQLDDDQKFFAQTLRADGSLGVHLNVAFNVRQSAERGADQLVGWMLSSANQSAVYPNGQSGLDWVAGQPLALDLTWAELSRWAPYVNPAVPNPPDVEGRTATFSAGGTWALMRLVQQHAMERGAAAADGITLRFSVPVASAASVAAAASVATSASAGSVASSAGASRAATPPLSSASTAQLMINLQLQGVDPVSHAAAPLKLPAFPTGSPALPASARTSRGGAVSAQIPVIPSIPPLPPGMDGPAPVANTAAVSQGSH
ncbi:type VI secretion system protein [Paraburkholderia bryophila]|uniref:type VI secretion system protein n=1 Tax=Paraburkholderia bryophila TaxID=420952 RepID=UPI00234B09EE|nr:type VI secretion system protein [Paraburkholderia bryophila]WCM24484.1 type VI secretion system protein [Paraburkholderia bryophila]